MLITFNSFKVADAIMRHGFYLTCHGLGGKHGFRLQLQLGRSIGQYRP